MKNSRLVYSTDQGRIDTDSASKKAGSAQYESSQGGKITISVEKKGRRGKAVTLIKQVPVSELDRLCKRLKSLCATGGTVKHQTIEIQGEHMDTARSVLIKEGLIK